MCSRLCSNPCRGVKFQMNMPYILSTVTYWMFVTVSMLLSTSDIPLVALTTIILLQCCFIGNAMPCMDIKHYILQHNIIQCW